MMRPDTLAGIALRMPSLLAPRAPGCACSRSRASHMGYAVRGGAEPNLLLHVEHRPIWETAAYARLPPFHEAGARPILPALSRSTSMDSQLAASAYRDPTRSIDDRTEDLLARMTLD